MNFNSLDFLIFLPVVLIVYWVIPNKFRWIWLLASSYYFYMSWNRKLVFLILGTTIVSYVAGLLLEKVKKEGLRKLILVIVLSVCIGLLLFFKYFNFLVGSVIELLNLFSMNLTGFSLDIILPIGISFYTFQTLSYVIDVYKGKIKAEKHFGYYALFVSFFPQLVAGPIERPGDLIPQLKAEHNFNKSDFSVGLRILLTGFFFKCVAADYIGIFVNTAFSNIPQANALCVLLMGFLFTVQMYCDFAGYAEIATGAARMMGIRLSRNFNRPELSSSYTDFFRRWHITLTRWFTDYVYIPLGGNRKGKVRKMVNTYIVFLLCGLWHGANWTYVVWGAYAAFFLCIENILKGPLKKLLINWKINTATPVFRAFRTFYTFALLIPAGLIFRSTSLSEVVLIFKQMFTKSGFGAAYFEKAVLTLGLNTGSILQIIIFVIIVAMLPQYAEIGRVCEEQTKPGIRQMTVRLLVASFLLTMIFLCWMGLLSFGGTSEFQYFQF